jgi:predicted ArsR family transcriptional regulator
MGLMGADPSDLLRAKALGDATRVSIYRLVCEGPWPVDVARLTAAVGLHHTAVRQHLVKLRDAGLILEASVPPSGRGRPRLCYRPNPEVVAPDGGSERYRHLAALLAEAVRTGDSVRDVGRRAGRRAGRAEVAEAPGREPLDVLLGEASRLGFQPSREGDDVVLMACPYAAVAAADPATVCALHLGLAEGFAEGVGGLEVTYLEPRDPHVAGCRLGVITTRLTR